MAVGKNLKRSSNDGIMIFLEKRGKGGVKIFFLASLQPDTFT